MHLVCVGLSHKTARVEKREKASLSRTAARAMLRALAGADEATEVVALSTCNRTELYAVGAELSTLEESLCTTLVGHSAIPRPELDCARYLHLEEHAAGHLFRVASGLDSMVIGESEIQGQVRSAWETAQEEETSGVVLNHVFRQAVEAGKRVRHETRISAGPTSVAAVAVRLAREAFGELPRRKALLIGAGQAGETTAQSLIDSGLSELVVANRTVSTSRAVAEKVGGRGVGFDQIAVELQAADIVISSTDAPHHVLARDDIERVMAGRPTRPLVLIDIAVPRDLDPRIGEVKGAVLYDIDDLDRAVEESVSERVREAERAEAIVAAEARRFAEWRHGLTVAPTISSLRERAEQIRQRELQRADGRWDSLSHADRDRIDALTRAIVNKLLHEPTVRARAAALEGDGLVQLEVLRHLFDLPA